MGKKYHQGKKKKGSGLTTIAALLAVAGIVYMTATFLTTKFFPSDPPPRREKVSSRPPREPSKNVPAASAGAAEKHANLEWQMLSRDMDECLRSQDELMTIPVPWPGFHVLCIDEVGAGGISVRLHSRSGDAGQPASSGATRALNATPSAAAHAHRATMSALIDALKRELLPYEFLQARAPPRELQHALHASRLMQHDATRCIFHAAAPPRQAGLLLPSFRCARRGARRLAAGGPHGLDVRVRFHAQPVAPLHTARRPRRR